MRSASNFSKKSSKKQNDKRKSNQPGEVRIIGGQWRGRRLAVQNKEGLRPTTDRLKETLFNWLMMDIRGAKVLDCFAGAGSLSFEAASRQAKSVTCIEKDKQAAKQLKLNCQVLQAESKINIIQGDFFAASRLLNQSFNLVFIDPPFHKGLVADTFQTLIEQGLLDNNSRIYLEQESNSPFDLSSSEYSALFDLKKEKKAGQVLAQLFVFNAPS